MYLGADPEFAVIDRDGKSVSAHVAGIPGKDAKIAIAGLDGVGKGPTAKYFRDGWMIETNPRAELCRIYALSNGFGALMHIAKDLEVQGYTLSTQPTVPVSLEDIESAPDDVKHFGCDPSFDAYNFGLAKSIDVDGPTHPFRYSGGHLHFSAFDKDEYKRVFGEFPRETCIEDNLLTNPDNYPDMVKWLDLLVGLPLAYIFGDAHEFKRRELYGQAGEYRPQAYPWAVPERKEFQAAVNEGKGGYVVVKEAMLAPKILKGLEYRVPSSRMYENSGIVHAAMGIARKILRTYYQYGWDKSIEPELRGAINTGDGIEKLIESRHIPIEGYWGVPALKYLRNYFFSGKLKQRNWTKLSTGTWGEQKGNSYLEQVPSFSPIVDTDGRNQ